MTVRQNLREKAKGLIPEYARWPLIACFLLNVAVYYLPRILLQHPHYHDLTLPVDLQLPLVPAFMLVYYLAFPVWAVGLVVITREEPERCGAVFGEMVAKLICLAFFLAFPTTLQRPEPEGRGFFVWLLRLNYALDRPDNLFPSIHCMLSWVCWRGAWGLKKVGWAYKGGMLLAMLLIFASTLLVKQHVVVDIPAGILAGEIGLLISSKARLGKRYAAWWKNRRGTA